MRKKYLIILTGIVVAYTGGLAGKSLVKESTGPNYIQWEYGMYRGGNNFGDHLTPGDFGSWQDAKGYLGSRELHTLLEEMGFQKIKFSADEFDTFEVKLLNFLGSQGWELVWIKQDLQGRPFFLFKRAK